MITSPVSIKKGFISVTFILEVYARKAIVYSVFPFLIRNNLKRLTKISLYFHTFSWRMNTLVNLKEDERLDYLLAENLRIIQSPSVFAFSLDAVLLARFVYVPIQKGNLIDLCSGNGVIPLFLSARTKGQTTGVEIQERLYDMAVRSIEYNRLDNRLHMIHGDIKEMSKLLG